MSKLFIIEHMHGVEDFNKADLLILRGQPGAGKSTWAEQHMSMSRRAEPNREIVLAEADQYFTHDGQYLFDKTKLPQAHAWCLGKVRQNLREGKRVIVSNTHTKLYMVQPYIETALDGNKSFAIVRIFGCFHSTKPGVNRFTVIKHIREYEDFTWERYEREVLNPPVASKEKLQQLVTQNLDEELKKYIKRD